MKFTIGRKLQEEKTLMKEVNTSDIIIKMDYFSMRYSEAPIKGDSFFLHCHEDYELFFFYEGNADYMVEGNQYHLTPNSVLLLSHHVFHGVRVNHVDIPYKRIVINIDPAFVSVDRRFSLFSMFPSDTHLDLLSTRIASDYTSTLPFNYFHNVSNDVKVQASKKAARTKPNREVYYEHTDLFNINFHLQSIIQCCENKHPISSELIVIYVEALLAQLTLMCQSLSPIPHDNSVSERLSDIIQYLNGHLDEAINLESLEKRFFINRHYLNRIFREATGTTVMNYLQFKRIILARELLLAGASAQEVSLKVGFLEYSTFYRAFKKEFNLSPRDYKEFYTKNQSLES